ncbi:hypothetical protein Lfu02_00370 [Longispora fulva]|uniref:Subtilisin inhibitor domain-containing protein n=1 Tax=Longispora fulva TaxID=619741 RepID=A0A8J7GDN7_9ACTN|nr:SSI family serine proteinase inhibitor [Longispora fulva]MBG6136090.1 hypothetical protein [Longispora fulva]GIG55665.1 hypothetical protein Lfu02_00370 [Longispora fulva]
MRRLVATAGTLLMAGAVAATLGAGTAQAATTSTPVLLGSLHLTKTDNAGTTTQADLTCVRGINVQGQIYVSGSGTVTNPVAACQELNTVNGDLTKLIVHPTWFPTNVVAPVSVTATGNWGATTVDFSRTYTNGSVLAKYTGDVFQF